MDEAIGRSPMLLLLTLAVFMQINLAYGLDCMPDEELFIITEVMRNYSKFSLPRHDGVNVSAEFTLNAVTGLSERRSEFEIDIFFSEIWHDPKLNYSHLNVCALNITMDNSYLKQIWQPNICIVNSKASHIHESPSQNIFLILYSDGRVWRNCRMKVTAPCTIDLKVFPFDQQKCTLLFESYSFNVQKVRLMWFEPTPVTILGDVDLPDFVLSRHISTFARVEYPNGAWDRLNLTFYFSRKYGFFVLQLYIPTYMTIFIAWISLWMDSTELATRATLTISAFLAMTLQFGNILVNMPPVSYIKLIDLWMLGGIMFLFITLAELAVISHLIRTDGPNQTPKRKRLKSPRVMAQNGYCGSATAERLASPNCYASPAILLSSDFMDGDVSPSPSTADKLSPERRPKNHRPCDKPAKLFGRWTPYQIDYFSLIGFTPLFLVYNVIYWSLCYHQSHAAAYVDY